MDFLNQGILESQKLYLSTEHERTQIASDIFTHDNVLYIISYFVFCISVIIV